MGKRKAVKAKAASKTSRAQGATATAGQTGMNRAVPPRGHTRKAKYHIAQANSHANRANLKGMTGDKVRAKAAQPNPQHRQSRTGRSTGISVIPPTPTGPDSEAAHRKASRAHVKAAKAHRKAAKSRKKK